MKENMQEKQAAQGVSRRKFLTYAGGIAGATLLLDACKKDDDPEPVNNDAIDLGSGDAGLLNYAYALEQLEAAFYIKVLTSPFAQMNIEEKMLLEDIRDHEIAHREFFKNFLAEKAIPSLEFDFSSIDFSSKSSVMNTAKTFEDLGVSAYNGAAALFITADNLVMASKIVSVEARHAATIKNMLKPGSFSDTTDANGADSGKGPADVLALVKPYIKSNISASNLPKS